MKMIHQQFQVPYQYPVYFTRNLFLSENDAFSNFIKQNTEAETERRALFILDEGMLIHHPKLQEEIKVYFRNLETIKLTPSIIIPGGEVVKNTSSYLEKIITAINAHKIDRHSYIITIGGGAVLDLAGYAAATAHRGIRHIRIPTTVLSQNDSGVGVKNGINYFGKKNFLGTFAPPYAVFNDSAFLETLDDRNWRSGIAEAVKVALIKDARFFDWLEIHATDLVNRNVESMAVLVYRCAALHLQHIASGDPFESGSSRPLDFGHWSAHKLEQLSHFSVLHGEAVAMGIALDTLYSQEIGWLNHTDVERIIKLLQMLQLKLFHSGLEAPELINGLKEFREHLGGALTVMLLKGIGQGENIHHIDQDIMRNCVHTLKEYALNNISIPKNSIA